MDLLFWIAMDTNTNFLSISDFFQAWVCKPEMIYQRGILGSIKGSEEGQSQPRRKGKVEMELESTGANAAWGCVIVKQKVLK